jgi:hypothetical protein
MRHSANFWESSKQKGNGPSGDWSRLHNQIDLPKIMASIPQPEHSVKATPRFSEWKRRQQVAETVSYDVPAALSFLRQALTQFQVDRATSLQSRFLSTTIMPCSVRPPSWPSAVF